MLTVTSNTLQKTVNAMSRNESVASAFVQWMEYEVSTEELNRFINTLKDGRERRAYQMMRDAVMLTNTFAEADRAIAAVGDRKLQREMRNIMASMPTTQYALSLLKSAGAGAWYDASDLTQYKATYRCNLLTYSEQFDNAVWAKAACSVTPNTAVAPDGTTTMDTLVEDATSAYHYLQPASTTVTARPYTASIRAKLATGTRKLVIREGVSTGAYATFDLSAGTVAASGAGGVGAITPLGSGVYLCSMTYTAVAGTASTQLALTNGTAFATYTGDGTSGIYLWGAQLEVGSSATAY